jgi:Mrp family chromosome partitioning ATPase
MVHFRWRTAALVLLASLTAAYAAAVMAPREYLATGGVLLPAGMVKYQSVAEDPATALAVVQAFIDKQPDARLVDRPLVVPVESDLPWYLVVAGLLLAGLALWRRTAPMAGTESGLDRTLGAPMLAARPLAVQALSHQLLAHWFGKGRTTLAVVSAQDGAGRRRVAAELARAFARMGEPTLLIDADFRSPGQHRAFGLANRSGLADFLEGRAARLAQSEDNLAVLVAGRSAEDPLELLGRPRMRELLSAAAKRYRVVLVDAPAAALGPDLQLPAAFSGGALVVADFADEVPALERLRDLLAFCKARVVGTVLAPA